MLIAWSKFVKQHVSIISAQIIKEYGNSKPVLFEWFSFRPAQFQVERIVWYFTKLSGQMIMITNAIIVQFFVTHIAEFRNGTRSFGLFNVRQKSGEIICLIIFFFDKSRKNERQHANVVNCFLPTPRRHRQHSWSLGGYRALVLWYSEGLYTPHSSRNLMGCVSDPLLFLNHYCLWYYPMGYRI